MKRLTFFLLFFSAAVLAGPNIAQIYDGEFNMDGTGCWMVDGKSRTLFYSNKEGAKIKLENKIISLSPKKMSDQSPALSCEKNYTFLSADNSTTVEVALKKNQSGHCIGKLIVSKSKGRSTLRNLKLTCAD